jgi:hypothetical protein
MKLKIIISLLIGALFYMAAFNQLWIFFIQGNADQIVSHTSSWSIYYAFPEPFSRLFYFINPLRLGGLILAGIIAYLICKRLQLSRINLLPVLVMALVINKLFLQTQGIFHYGRFSTPTDQLLYFLLRFVLLTLAGTVFMVLPLYFRHFRYANRVSRR